MKINLMTKNGKVDRVVIEGSPVDLMVIKQALKLMANSNDMDINAIDKQKALQLANTPVTTIPQE